MYATDDCANPTTLGYDVVKALPMSRLHRLGTYASAKVARETARQVGGWVIDRTA